MGQAWQALFGFLLPAVICDVLIGWSCSGDWWSGSLGNCYLWCSDWLKLLRWLAVRNPPWHNFDMRSVIVCRFDVTGTELLQAHLCEACEIVILLLNFSPGAEWVAVLCHWGHCQGDCNHSNIPTAGHTEPPTGKYSSCVCWVHTEYRIFIVYE